MSCFKYICIFFSLSQRPLDILKIDYYDDKSKDVWTELSKLVEAGELKDVRQLVVAFTSPDGTAQEDFVRHLQVLRYCLKQPLYSPNFSSIYALIIYKRTDRKTILLYLFSSGNLSSDSRYVYPCYAFFLHIHD